MSVEIFSARLKDLMEFEGFSKRKLSKQIFVDRTSVLNWCNGKYYPRYDTLIKLADFFKVSTDYLVGLENDNYKEFYSEFPIDKVPDIFKMRVKEALLSLKMSEYRLAKTLGVEQGMISKWKKQPHLPEVTTIIEISQILKCSLDFLLGRTSK